MRGKVMANFVNLNSILADEIGLNYGQLKLQRSPNQSNPYNFIFPPMPGSTGQALFWNGSETTFRGIAIADITNLNTELTNIYGILATFGTAATKNTGTTSGTVPLIGAGDKLASGLIPDINSTNNAAFTINADATNTGSDRSLILSTSNQTSSYTLALPPTIGTANQGLIISSVIGSTVNLNWGSSGGGFNNVSSHSSASINIDLASGNMVTIALNQSTTISSITGIPSGVQGISFYVRIAQDATGGKALYLASGMTLTGTIDLSANSISLIQFTSFNGGTNWDAIVLKPLSSGGSTLWTPANLATKWWFDPSDSSTISIGSGVSQINDKKGLGSLTQSTASSQPAYITNGLNNRNILRFDGNDSLSHASYNISSARTIAAVFKQDSTQSNYAGLIGGDFICTTNIQLVSLRKTGDPSIGIDSSVNSTQFNIVIFQIAPNNALLRVNGTSIGTDISYNSFSGTLSLGGGGVVSLIGDMAEIIITESTLSVSEIEKLEGYFAFTSRWNLQSRLPSDHPYKSSHPTV